jgi:hypothetical protein
LFGFGYSDIPYEEDVNENIEMDGLQ